MTTKNIAVKFVAGDRPTETIGLQPGTTATDVLRHLSLPPAEFVLTDSREADRKYTGGTDLYAACAEGDLIYCSPFVDAGCHGLT